MATIAEERAANARARAEGYANAAAKEAHASAGARAAGFSNSVQQEIDANRRAQAAGFRNAAEKEMDANRRSREAGFTSAVDQEIDANRRAREAGYLNAADLETFGAAGATRSTAPFVDPRTQPAPAIPPQFALGSAPRSMHTAGPAQVPMSRLPASRPLNNAMPTFQGPDYYNQMFNRPLQNWSQFMPANSRLAGGGGALYQNPWGYGTGGGSGWGGSFGGGGGMMGGGYPGGGFIGGGGYPGGGPFPGGSWFPGGGGGGPLGPRPGSDKANDLAAGRTHHPQMYDLDDNWVGAEGTETIGSDPFGIGNRILGLMGADTAEDQRLGTYSSANYDESMLRSFDPSTGTTPTTGLPNTPLADKQAYMDMMDITGQPGASFNDFSAANPYAAGPPGASWNDYSAANPYAATGQAGASWDDYNAPNRNWARGNLVAAEDLINAGQPLSPGFLEDVTSGVDSFRSINNQAAAAQAQAQALAQQQAYDQNVAIGLLGADPEGADADGDRGQGGSGMGGRGGGPGQW